MKLSVFLLYILPYFKQTKYTTCFLFWGLRPFPLQDLLQIFISSIARVRYIINNRKSTYNLLSIFISVNLARYSKLFSLSVTFIVHPVPLVIHLN